MRQARGECGQAITEYAALVLVVAMAMLALSSIDLGPQLADALAGSVCEVTGLASCREEGESSRETVDRYADGDLDDFLAYRDSRGRDPDLDYTSDACSTPLIGSSGLTWNFLEACVRHDFGYRNYRRLGLFDENRGAVDRVFLDDMRDHCASRSLPLRPTCLQRAAQFYGAVRAFGG